jgi:hypothetical protein
MSEIWHLGEDSYLKGQLMKTAFFTYIQKSAIQWTYMVP